MLRPTPTHFSPENTLDGVVFVKKYGIPAFRLLRIKEIRRRYWYLWKLRIPGEEGSETRGIANAQNEYLFKFVDNCGVSLRKRRMMENWYRKLAVGRLSRDETYVSSQFEVRRNEKHREFASDLRQVVRAIANNATTLSTIEENIAKVESVREGAMESAKSAKSAIFQASDRYDQLLKFVSEKKMEYRDEVTDLQLRIGSKKREQKPLTGKMKEASVRQRLIEESNAFHAEMGELEKQFQEVRDKAVGIRRNIEDVVRRNHEIEADITKLTEDRDALGDIEESVLLLDRNQGCASLTQLLVTADNNLQESAEMIQRQTVEMRNLDVQIIRRRKILTDLKHQMSSKHS